MSFVSAERGHDPTFPSWGSSTNPSLEINQFIYLFIPALFDYSLRFDATNLPKVVRVSLTEEAARVHRYDFFSREIHRHPSSIQPMKKILTQGRYYTYSLVLCCVRLVRDC